MSAQLIDADGVYSGALHVPTEVASSTNYGVVAVIGCQSGGKSTLLNSAFGTRFPVLDTALRGRRRTTLGVWGAVVSADTRPLVVLDIEGVDSRERGDGARAFESRTSLLALAVAEVVIVNMWAHDIGRYSAANYDLFETVFAHAALLRASGSLRHRVRILIAIRDYDGHAELNHVRNVLLGDLTAIWQRIRIRNISFDDLFDFQFAALPHLKYAHDAFVRSVGVLRNLVDELVRTSLNDAVEIRTPLVAFDALGSAVWNDVQSVTGGVGDDAAFSLDVPKHAALAAHYSLGRIILRVLDELIEPAVDSLRDDVEAEWRTPLERYAERVADITESALSKYDTLAAPLANAKNGSNAAEARRRELGVALVQRIGQLRERYLWVCRDSTMRAFEEEFGPLVGNAGGYLRQARRLANKYIKRYRERLEEARYPDLLSAYVEEEETLAAPVDGYGSDPPSDETLTVLNAERNNDDGDGPLLLGSAPAQDARMAAIAALDIDTDEEGADEFALDRFMRDVHQMVEEKRRLGELMVAPTGPRKPPLWKNLLVRGLMLFINYLQVRSHNQSALRAVRKHEEEFPAVPSW